MSFIARLSVRWTDPSDSLLRSAMSRRDSRSQNTAFTTSRSRVGSESTTSGVSALWLGFNGSQDGSGHLLRSVLPHLVL